MSVSGRMACSHPLAPAFFPLAPPLLCPPQFSGQGGDFIGDLRDAYMTSPGARRLIEASVAALARCVEHVGADARYEHGLDAVSWITGPESGTGNNFDIILDCFSPSRFSPSPFPPPSPLAHSHLPPSDPPPPSI